MKHSKKKKRPRPPVPKTKQSAECGKPAPGQIDDQSRVLNDLTEGIASFSIEETIENLTETTSNSSANRDDDSAESFGNSTETSSSSGSYALSNCDGYNHRIGGKVSKGHRGNKVIAATGMVSTVLGKDYVKRRGVSKWKGFADEGASHEDAEQFLCSMLSDDCELGMDLVKDVLCQTAYDVEKALDILLELTASSSELPNSGQHHTSNTQSKDNRAPLEASYNLTNRTSDLASSSKSDLHSNISYTGCNGRNYFDVLANNCGSGPPPGPKTSSELTQDVLESLFYTRKSSKHEPGSMNWRNVVKKMESFGQMLDYPSEDTNDTTKKQQHVFAKGDDYHNYRNTASQHWDSMKSYYHKAATAYASGKREYAAYLSDQGRMCNEKARQADERAGHDIFDSRNKTFENVITIDLHGQHVKQGMKLLKLHLLFGAYVRSVRVFRVITGCGSHGLGRSKLKQSVVTLLETENIDWKEENRGTLLIKLNGQREFSFLDSGSDSE
ncbi:unnamed protein product [Lactuca saligna]|uniref:Smr domain-containing protein n=1 Tax=Lactuca saligna TaxID=75948 RepID=A0AA35ZZ44_LACSI|nr:unnamed protein product [Lactuca saligna]